jgi:hypothetical protein
VAEALELRRRQMNAKPLQ